jgi:hypothetical protein
MSHKIWTSYVHVLPCTPSQEGQSQCIHAQQIYWAAKSLINSAYVHFIRAYRPIAFVIYVSLDVTAPSLNRDTWQKIPTFFKNNLNGQAWINKCVSLIRGGRHVTEASFLVPFTSTFRLMVQILAMLLFSFKKIVFPRRKWMKNGGCKYGTRKLLV